MSAPGSIVDAFVAAYGAPPDGVWQAPGRVTLVGEHTDYADGLAITFAIDRRTTVVARRRRDGRVRLRSTGQTTPPGVDLADLAPGRAAGWAAYPLGVLWALGQEGFPVPGLDLSIHSTVPVGRGLSSSAALTMAVAAAAIDLGGGDGPDPVAVCHRAENDFVGAPTGLMDQLTLARARAGHALLIDFQTLAVETLPLDAGPLVVVDTGVSHRNDDGTYAERRQSCEAAAAVLGVGSLRNVGAVDRLTGLEGVLARRARHVVTENERVRHAARLLRATPVDLRALGAVLDASHRSLRDDYEVSWPEADLAVEAVRDAGAAGARMVGAGLGGCCLALGAPAEAVAAAVGRTLGPGAAVLAVAPAEGAGRVV